MEVVFTLRITTIHLRKYTRCIRIALWLLSINSVIENTPTYRSFKKSLMSSDTKECCAWDNESCNLSGMRENDIRYNVSYSRSSSKISISTIIILTALSLNQNRFISTPSKVHQMNSRLELITHQFLWIINWFLRDLRSSRWIRNQNWFW